MLVMSIPTNIKFTGNQTLTNLHVNGSVEITPRILNIETIITEMRFCIHKSVMNLFIFTNNVSSNTLIEWKSLFGIRKNKRNTYSSFKYINCRKIPGKASGISQH